MVTLLHELVDVAARQWPDRLAVSTKTEEHTHADLAAASVNAAAWLHGLGVRRGDRVVVVGPSDALVPALAYAISRIGAMFVVVHEDTRNAAFAHILDDAEPALVVTASDITSTSALRPVRVASFVEARSAAFDSGHAGGLPACTPGPLPVDPVCLIYTSGTTARPKAVVTTHQQATFVIAAIQSMLGYHADDVVYCPLPLSFDYGLYQLFLGATSGAHVRLGRTAEVGPGLLTNIVAARATVLAAVPAVAGTLATLLRRQATARPPLRLLTNTGAAMPPEILAALRSVLPDLHVQLMFGLTECKRAAIMPPDGDLDRPGACGLALPGTEVFAIDAEGIRLPAGEMGELVVRGPHVMAGYWRSLEWTDRRFPRKNGLFPELHTGDHGWLDEDGYVYFIGRFDDIYKEHGFRVSVTEVEAAAHRVSGIELAAVVPPLDGRSSVLVVVGNLTPDQVLSRMRVEIEDFKIPRRCVVVDRLPLTHNGKVDRATLRREAAG